jgi:hypothetical protein
MTTPADHQINHFNRVFDSWKGGTVQVDIRFLSILVDGVWMLLHADIKLLPLACEIPASDIITTSELKVGQIRSSIDSAELDVLIENARRGELTILDTTMALSPKGGVYTYAPFTLNEPDFGVAQLEVRTNNNVMLSHQFDYVRTNAELRCNPVPFDGMMDLLSFFGLGTNGHLPQQPTLSVLLHPPADIVVNSCGLEENRLKLKIIKRQNYTPEQVAVGIRQYPNANTSRRKQIGGLFTWTPSELQGFDSGHLEIDVEDCATAQIILSLDGFTVRRLVVLDPHKSLNTRLTDYRYLDPNLTQLNKFLFSPKDSRQLEVGTAALLHLLGASSLNPPGNDTPDVIVETPSKKLALVECTTKVESIREKVGKLVGRRDGLIAAESRYGISRDVMAILLVNQPASSIVDEQEFLSNHQIVLLTVEDISLMLSTIEFPPDLDKFYLEKLESLRSSQKNLFNDTGMLNFNK